MTQTKSLSIWDVGKILGIGAITVGVNYWFQKQKEKHSHMKNQEYEPAPEMKKILTQIIQISSKRQIQPYTNDSWGELKIPADKKDPLLIELSMMAQLMCSFQKVNNLIVDLQLTSVNTYPCPLVANTVKRMKDQPSLDPESLVTPGEFVIQNCVFRAGQSVECQKKYMRAGPRATQYFEPSKVKADIVVLGKVAPGVNNIIRQLVILLKDVYKVKCVEGVRFSYLGYYQDKYVELTSELVETIHHHGGSYLGVCKTEFHPDKIVDKLVARGVNQVYLIGGNDTLVSAHDIYLEIKKRKLNIGICVCLKAVNKDIAVFDTCFGFESAVEQTQRFIEEAYCLTKSSFNSVVLVKVPGRYSGFLAMDAAKAARNVNICLVPEFSYDLYGERGLLKYIGQRVKLKGFCIVIYSQGASYAVRDIEKDLYARILRKKEYKEEYAFDVFLKKQIEKELNAKKISPNTVYLFDSQNAVRSVPANSLDTKLCCQIALCSIQGLMCGYTNFAIGHLKNRVAMVPNRNMVQTTQKFSLKANDENWFRLLASTGQSSFRNEQEQNRE